MKLERGQLPFGIPSLAAFLNTTEKRIRNRLKVLERDRFLHIKRTNRFSVATVLNYNKYNPQKNTEGKQTGRQREFKGQHLKNYKELKEINIKEYEAFSLPSQEILNDASYRKIEQDLDAICEILYRENIFPQVHIFKNTMLKTNGNKRAILHTLTRCYTKGKIDGFKRN